ncbi:MAG: YeeE/YedE thiosulfate transporter family protein, partial [Hydrogenovibrio sp.]|nr:YeeE/YedE thiosulfate transporter family protein [Hydrogenovibrio sp.]
MLLSLLAISLLIQNPYLGYFTIGGLLGAGLNYFQFGFRTCSQQLLSDGRTLGIRSVLIMLAVTTFLFFPLLEIGHYSTPKLTGFVQPLSLSVIFGAFIFGVGMQLSNGCTSGTLNKLGQLQPLSFTAFIFLLVGGTLAAYHHEFWRAVPALNAISLPQTFGWFPALILQLGVIALLYRWLLAREKKRYQDVVPLIPSFKNIRQWHPWLLAGILLALLNTLLLITSGQPWSIANIFPLWG